MPKLIRTKNLFALVFAVLAGSLTSVAANTNGVSIEEFNKRLSYWGTSWSPGANATNGYYPSFYTGFAMRSQYPDRIHVRTARGNQTRISVILDHQTISDYLFDLKKRSDFYQKMTLMPKAALNINPSGSSTLPQMAYFRQIVESETYQILKTVEASSEQRISAEELYQKSLLVLSTLNAGRIFNLKIDLTAEFLKWKLQMQQTNSSPAAIVASPVLTISSINSLLLGRINMTAKPNPEILAQLERTISLALENAPNEQFIPAAYQLFTMVTGSKYAFKVLNPETNQFENALKCSVQSCTLSYPEFTTVYPTGTIMAMTSDELGNRINSFATPGLWQFVQRGEKGVDNIRDEPFYGFAPKLDYEAIGNGFHNPAVRFWNPSKDLKAGLGIQSSHNTLWAVKRGGVSNGCLRLPLGHLWEMRHILPVENEKMVQVHFFSHRPQDFDVFDIYGTGKPMVMGVEYMISYGLQGTDGLAKREGTGFEINSGKKIEFYQNLYGVKGVFEVRGQNEFVFKNPRISLPSHLDFKKQSVAARLVLPGDYPLYEQPYEREKVQLYAIGAITPETKKIIRLMGRVRGCSPNSDKKQCGEYAFDQEAKQLLR